MAKRITLNVDDQFHRLVKSKAAERGLTIAALIRRLLRAWLEDVRDG